MASSTTTIDAVDGMRVDLEARLVALAKVELRADGHHVPWPDDFPVAASRVDGEGEVRMRGGMQTGIRFNVSEPGLYRLELPPIEGYRPLEPVEIQMVSGEEQNVVVELQRLR